MMKFLVTVLFIANAFSQECPDKEEVQSILNRVLKAPFTVKSVEPSRIKQLCRINTNEGETFFIDNNRTCLIEGILIPIPELEFSQKEMRRLNKLVAFSIGEPNTDKFVYVFVDPACETCRKNSRKIENFVKNRIQVRFILAPITHEGKGFESAVSIICDGKNFKAFTSGYNSGNLCDRGKLKIWSTVDLLKLKGITSVPVFVTPDGKVFHGANSVKKVIENLKIKPFR